MSQPSAGYWLKSARREQPVGHGPGCELGSGVEVELAENTLDVDSGRALRDHQALGDLSVRQTPGSEASDFGFPRGQTEGTPGRGRYGRHKRWPVRNLR